MSEKRLQTEVWYNLTFFKEHLNGDWSLPPPHLVDEEEQAFLTEVDVSARLELLDEQQEEEEQNTS